MSTILFSILIPTLNRGDLLQMAIETIRRQDYKHWEIIVSDNCSEEDIVGRLDALHDDRIKFVRQHERIPVTENWNAALRHSNGDYILMLGDDDGLMPGYLSAMASLIERSGKPDLVFTAGYIFSYPGVHPQHPDGFLQCFRHSLDSRVGIEECELSDEMKREIVKASLKFRMLVNFNMQYSLFSRELKTQMERHGGFFQSPFPDFYATNAMLLEARRVIYVAKPWVIIGISKKSYGYFHFNNNELDGTAFLGNQNLGSVSEASRLKMLPGSWYLTSWLVALDRLCVGVGKEKGFRPDYNRYRRLQIASVLKSVLVDRRGKFSDLKLLAARLMTFEVVFFLLPLSCLFCGLAMFPIKMKKWFFSFLSRMAVGQSQELGKGDEGNKCKNIVEVFISFDSQPE